MNYRQAKKIVLEVFSQAILSWNKNNRNKIEKWTDKNGFHERVTVSLQQKYFIADYYDDLCLKKRFNTIAQAWIHVAQMLSPEKEMVEKQPVRYPLYETYMKCKKTKNARMAKSKAKIARYSRSVTDSRFLELLEGLPEDIQREALLEVAYELSK